MSDTSPIIKRLQEDPQSLLPIGYVALVIIGMINEAIYFKQFEINIFEYSEIFDFLIAPFKKLQYIFILFAAFIISSGAFTFDRYLQNKHPGIHNLMNFGVAKKSWFPVYRQISMTATFLILFIFYSYGTSSKFKKDLSEEKQNDITLVFDSETNSSISGRKIGANKSFLFLLTEDSKVHIIPISGGKVEQILPKTD